MANHGTPPRPPLFPPPFSIVRPPLLTRPSAPNPFPRRSLPNVIFGGYGTAAPKAAKAKGPALSYQETDIAGTCPWGWGTQ